MNEQENFDINHFNFNQKHVDVVELQLEKQRWNVVSAIMVKFCIQNKILFSSRNCERLNKYKGEKVLLPWLFDLIDYDYLKGVADQCSQLGKKLYVITDSWIDNDKFCHPSVIFFSIPKLFGLTALTGQAPLPKVQTKLYNSFNHRADAVRQSWFYFLYLKNLLDQGYVSYRLYHIRSTLTGKDLFDHIHQEYLSKVEHFNQAYDNLKNCVPYGNFEDRSDLANLILETKYSLVSDTYATADDVGAYYISEKVTRALQYPNISLLFLQKGTLHKLSQDGIYIHPKLLEIDSCKWIERQQKILQILENDSITESAQSLCDHANHNRTVLNSWLDQCLDKNLYEEVFETILSD